jgi:outer membrane cobalamin receptor
VGRGQLWIEDQMTLAPSWQATLGLALHGDSYLDRAYAEPRLRLEYLADAGLIWSAALGRYHELPETSQIEQVFGNPRLRYLRSDHLVTAVEQLRDDGWYWKAELWRKRFDDLVTSDPLTRYDNDGEGSAVGAELLIRRTLTQHWSGWLALSWSEASRRDGRSGTRFDFEFDQPLIATLLAKYRRNDRWSFSARAKYHSGAPYTAVIGAEPDAANAGSYRAVWGEINAQRLPDYFRLDLRADYRVPDSGLGFYAELVNATDHSNVSGYRYNPDFSERKAVTQLPLFVYFGIRKQW